MNQLVENIQAYLRADEVLVKARAKHAELFDMIKSAKAELDAAIVKKESTGINLNELLPVNGDFVVFGNVAYRRSDIRGTQPVEVNVAEFLK